MMSILLAMLLACSGEAPADGECVGNGDCEAGAACIDATCTAVECVDSTWCDLDSYCDDAYTCNVGCQQDADCHAGSSCDIETSTCVTNPCTDTATDCAYGEFCNTTTGTCDDGGYDWCASCPLGERSSCGDGQICLAYFTDPSLAFCYPTCTTNEECPRGFTCEVFEGESYCLADCPWLVTSGYQ
ncbi:MAG: hypothetical protein V4850_29265 [Myxococcota bacterium]